MSDPPPIGDQLDRVLIDSALGVRIAVRHLAEAGHRRIGLVTPQDLSKPMLVRLPGFVQGMEENGLHADMSLVRIGDTSAEAGEALAGELLDAPDRPTALVIAHGRQSIGALRALRTRRVRVPEDLSLIVFGRLDYFDLFPVDLTVVILPLPEMGEAATRLLLDRLEERQCEAALDDLADGGERQPPEHQPRHILLPPTLHAGASVGPPARH